VVARAVAHLALWALARLTCASLLHYRPGEERYRCVPERDTGKTRAKKVLPRSFVSCRASLVCIGSVFVCGICLCQRLFLVCHLIIEIDILSFYIIFLSIISLKLFFISMAAPILFFF
jgi:hypothetical protein